MRAWIETVSPWPSWEGQNNIISVNKMNFQDWFITTEGGRNFADAARVSLDYLHACSSIEILEVFLSLFFSFVLFCFVLFCFLRRGIFYQEASRLFFYWCSAHRAFYPPLASIIAISLTSSPHINSISSSLTFISFAIFFHLPSPSLCLTSILSNSLLLPSWTAVVVSLRDDMKPKYRQAWRSSVSSGRGDVDRREVKVADVRGADGGRESRSCRNSAC